MSFTLARLGAVTAALIQLAFFGIGLWSRHLWETTREIDHLQLMNDVRLGLGVLWVLAIVAFAQLPRTSQARGFAMVAAGVAAVEACVDLGYRFALSPGSMTMESVELAFKLRAYLEIALSLGFAAMFALALGRIARAAAVGWLAIIGWATFVLVVVAWSFDLVGQLSGEPSAVARYVYYARLALFVGSCVATAAVLGRLPADAARPLASGELDPRWLGVAGGIRMCLVAIGLRVTFGLLAFVVLRGAAGASDFSELRKVADGVFAVAVLSGIAGVVLGIGLFRISRAPAAAGTGAMIALFLLLGGMGVDAIATKLTMGAFESVSAAFDAQEILPGLSAVGSALGIGAAAALLSSIKESATVLEAPELADFAGTTTVILVVAGIAGGSLQLVASHARFQLFLIVAALALPLLLFAGVRLILACVRLIGVIEARRR